MDPSHSSLSISRQCQLLELPRSSYYYQPATESEFNLKLMRMMDKQSLISPSFGSRMYVDWFCNQGIEVNRKRIQRLMKLMNLEAVIPRKTKGWRRTNKEQVFPYLLDEVEVTESNEVWSSDITYIPMASGFMYLTVILDWYSRFVLCWELSNTLDSYFVLSALQRAFGKGKPVYFNSDQGSQYTTKVMTETLMELGVQVSMAGKGRCFDNIFVERLWKTVKYEHVYLWNHSTVPALYSGLKNYFQFYNEERPHSSIGGKPPAEVYFNSLKSVS